VRSGRLRARLWPGEAELRWCARWRRSGPWALLLLVLDLRALGERLVPAAR
jgi:hypothetical protein